MIHIAGRKTLHQIFVAVVPQTFCYIPQFVAGMHFFNAGGRGFGAWFYDPGCGRLSSKLMYGIIIKKSGERRNRNIKFLCPQAHR